MKPEKVYTRCSAHLQGVLNPYKRGRVISDCIHALTPHKNKFDAIAVSGYSMALIAPTVADELGKGLMIVRKDGEDRASAHLVEGVVCASYIIIDDLVCSADTFYHVVNWIKDYHHSPAKLYGIYLYDIAHSSYATHASVEHHLKTKLLNTIDQVQNCRKENV